jgi:hypothetical protein
MVINAVQECLSRFEVLSNWRYAAINGRVRHEKQAWSDAPISTKKQRTEEPASQERLGIGILRFFGSSALT